jgi:SAM-dependent methyltransferase
MSSDPIQSEFDRYAENYDAALEKGISVSGEHKEYFARGRVAWLGRRADQWGLKPARLLDFGCGTGTSTPFLLERFPDASLVGVDISDRSLAVARKEHGSARARFALMKEVQPAGDIDLAFCNGVFHHIPVAERAACVDFVFRALRPGGVFAMGENNPWNPGTQLVMARIPFDRDAVKVPPPEARRLLRAGGFEVVGTDFLFFFPSILGFLRGLEPRLVGVPLGAQYLAMGRKPL